MDMILQVCIKNDHIYISKKDVQLVLETLSGKDIASWCLSLSLIPIVGEQASRAW